MSFFRDKVLVSLSKACIKHEWHNSHFRLDFFVYLFKSAAFLQLDIGDLLKLCTLRSIPMDVLSVTSILLCTVN